MVPCDPLTITIATFVINFSDTAQTTVAVVAYESINLGFAFTPVFYAKPRFGKLQPHHDYTVIFGTSFCLRNPTSSVLINLHTKSVGIAVVISS
ncbi:hypothetical protein TNCV_3644441 [Trichonephila clavipes]|nr:hypothetical protein TNCV_3644441 [Trichonephila clavipes]